MAATPQIRNRRGKEAGDWVAARIGELERQNWSADPESAGFSAELYIWRRIVGFRWGDYPDYTAPWHLLRWPHMRWEHVYQVVTIIEHLRQPTGGSVGASVVLQPFQVMILLCVLGPEDPDTGLRLIREALWTLARKGGKTFLTSAIVTTLLALHPEDHGLKGQEVQVGASDRDQAGITFHMCNLFVTQDRSLGISDKFQATPSKKLLVHKSTLSQLRCLSSDAYRAHGGNPAVVLLDEIGNVPNDQAMEFYSVLTTGYGAQREPLTLLFSTQAATDTHFFSQQVDRAKRVNEGLLEDKRFCGFVFALPEVDEEGVEFDPFDERWWYLANPGLGTITSLDDMRDWSKKARELPSLENNFRLLRLNQRVSENQAFLTRTIWARNQGVFDPDALAGRRCYLGVDLSETTDLCALVAVFDPLEEGGLMPVLPFAWLPGGGVSLTEKERRDKVPYAAWDRQGLIEVVPESSVDYRRVALRIRELSETYEVAGVAFDRWRAKFLRKELIDLGFDIAEKDDPWFRPYGQGYATQTLTVQRLEEAALDGRLACASNPVLNWNVANCILQRDPSGNRKFAKDRSFGRIDLVVALGMAVHLRDDLAADDSGPSIYSSEVDMSVLM